jgi:tetratricopeptide (TPR) repeat protein
MPGRVENTVFISYRRTNLPWALAIYQHLTQHGYDIFFDYESIKSGDFEQVIFQNVKGRAHFVVILTPSALERCNEPGDWLRREIETAIDEKRNIVPLFLEGFSFSSPAIAQHMTGKLELLKKYNGMNVPADYFDEAMERLRRERLNISLEAVLHPLSSTVQKAVEVQQTAANNATQIKQKELSAQEWFEQGYKHLQESNYDAAIQANTAAIALKPDFALAYVNRAAALADKGELEEGILDCNRAIELDPYIFNPYYIRGLAYDLRGDLPGAIQDYTESIRRNPNHAESYLGRSKMHITNHDWESAIADASRAISLSPRMARAYNNRAVARLNKGDILGAIKDCNEAIRLEPTFFLPYYNRATARLRQEDMDGAILDLTESIRLDPNYANAYLDRSYIYLLKGEVEKVIQDADQVLRLDPMNSIAYNNRGVARLQMKDLDGALQDLTEAIRISPNFALPYGGRGDAWWEKEDYYLVLDDYQKYLDLGGENQEIVSQRLAEAKKKLGLDSEPKPKTEKGKKPRTRRAKP